MWNPHARLWGARESIVPVKRGTAVLGFRGRITPLPPETGVTWGPTLKLTTPSFPGEGKERRREGGRKQKKRKSSFLSLGIHGPRNFRRTRMRVCFFDAGGASLRSVIVTAVSDCCGLYFGGSGWSLRRGAAGVASWANDPECSLVDDGILR